MPNSNHPQECVEDERPHGDLTLDLSSLPEWSPEQTDAENWRRGIALYDAWFDCLSKQGRRQYQTEQSDGRRAWIRQEIKLQLIDAIFAERLVAIGSVEGNLNGAPLSKLDAVLFRPMVCEIDWENGNVESLGKKFLAIHIVANLAEQIASPLASISFKPVAAEPRKQLDATPAVKRGGGRTDLYPLVEPILDDLMADPALTLRSAGALLDTFNAAYSLRYSTPNRKEAGVSERSLRTYLSRYRQQLARIGNN